MDQSYLLSEPHNRQIEQAYQQNLRKLISRNTKFHKKHPPNPSNFEFLLLIILGRLWVTYYLIFF